MILALAGCALAGMGGPPGNGATVPTGLPPAPVEPDLPVTCATRLADLASHWRRSQLAMDPSSARKAFREGWTGMPIECRTGAWYLLAARDLGRTPTRTLSTPDGITLHTTREALEAGLKVEPRHPETAAFLAFLAGVGADVPAVPAGSCAYLHAGDDQRYVCGITALADHRPAEAAEFFSVIADPTPYPDVGLRWHQAADAANVTVTLPPAIDHPPTDATCAAYGARIDECEKIRREWAVLPAP